MWIYTVQGFVSIVEDDHRKGYFKVRARFAGDLEAIFPRAKVLETDSRDYRFRVVLPREAVANVIKAQIEAIDYNNFKSAAQPERHSILARIWGVLFAEQERLYGRQNWGWPIGKKKSKKAGLPAPKIDRLHLLPPLPGDSKDFELGPLDEDDLNDRIGDSSFGESIARIYG